MKNSNIQVVKIERRDWYGNKYFAYNIVKNNRAFYELCDTSYASAADLYFDVNRFETKIRFDDAKFILKIIDLKLV